MIDTRPAPTHESTDSRALTVPLVAAQVLQNVLGGVGAGVVVGASMWLLHVPLEAAWRWPVGVAVITAGVATAWRAWIDEYRAGRNWARREAEHAEEMRIIIALSDRMESERNAYAQEAAALHNRVQWLEQRDKQPLRINGKPQELALTPECKDAETLIQKRYGDGINVTLRRMQANGWSQARYTAALEVLKEAGIVEVRGTQAAWVEHHSPDAALSALHDSSRVALHGNANASESEAD